MTSVSEDVLFLALTDTDALEALATIGLDLDAIPTEEMRPVVAWAVDRFFESGRTVAPSRAAMLETWGSEIEDAGVELLPEDEDVDNIQWAIETLKSQYVEAEFETLWRASAKAMHAAASPDRIACLAEQADALLSLSMRVQPRHLQVEVRRGFADALADYEVRQREGHLTKGMVFGLEAVDNHTYGIHEGEVAVFAAGPKVGKAAQPDTPVLTPRGWRQIGSLRTGDEVVGSDGRPTMVVGTRHWQDRPLMRVTTDDGGSVVVDAAHDWTVYPHVGNKPTMVVATETLGTIIQTNKRFAYLPVVAPVQYSRQVDLPLDPYLLGVLIGDGGLTSETPIFCKPEQFIHDEIDRLLPAGDERHWRDQDRGMASIVGGRTTAVLRRLGLMGCRSWERFIPMRYLWSSVAERRALLAGLLDTDGGVDGLGITFCSTSEALAYQVRELVLSLGGTARIKSKPAPKYQGGVGRPAWVVRLRLNGIPFRLPRKRDDYAARDAVVSRPPSRRIVEVVDAGRGETVCIEVAAADGLYVTDDFLVTHNSFGLLWIASQCWTKGDDTVLFTLENSVKMTVDRLVCMKLGIDYRRWQRGLCDQEEQDRVAWFINDHMPTMSAKFHVVMPEPGKRTMAAMVRHTQMLGVRRMFIDQLPFVEHPDPGRKPRNEIVRDMMHDCKSLISTGNEPVSAMIAHQISRDGMKRSSVANRLHMEDMAESSEVERTADWVFGLHQAEDDKKAGTALLEILAARREELNAWDMAWQPSYGVVAVTGRHVANPAPVATVVHS